MTRKPFDISDRTVRIGAGAHSGRIVRPPDAPPGPTEFEVRVRYAETDQMGVAHHAGYLVWFEAARTEFIRARGRSYAEIEEAGWLLVVVEAHCRYRRPVRYDEVLVIRTRLRSLGAATLSFGYEVVRRADGELLADGYTVHAAVDHTGKAHRIPVVIAGPLGPVDAEAPAEG